MRNYMNGLASEDSFLAFRYRNFNFLIPLCDVTRVDKEPPEDADVLDDGGGLSAYCYVLSQTASGVLAIGADEIYGLADVDANRQFAMPEEAKSPGNEWIFGVADMGDDVKPAFLLDIRVMKAHIDESLQIESQPK